MLPPSRRHQRRLCHPALRPPFFVMANYSALTDNMRNLLASCIYLMLEMRGADDFVGAGGVRSPSARHVLRAPHPQREETQEGGESVTVVRSIPPEEFTPPRRASGGALPPGRGGAGDRPAGARTDQSTRSGAAGYSETDLPRRREHRQPPPPVPIVPAHDPPQLPSSAEPPPLPEHPAVPPEPPDGEPVPGDDVSPNVFQSRHRRPKYPA